MFLTGGGAPTWLSIDEEIDLQDRPYKYLNHLIDKYENLSPIKDEIVNAFELLKDCYTNGGKLLVAGNGGSASDSQHIVGELMKRFVLNRPVPDELSKRLVEIDRERGRVLLKNLEMGLPAIALSAHEALCTAYINDEYAEGIFAQQVLGYGKSEDVFLGISTSGNSENIVCGAIVAKAKDLKTIGLTGASGGKLMELVDVCICAPEIETYKIQELHLPIYHCLCMMLEEEFFG